MPSSPVILLLPFGIALGLASLMRLIGGKSTGARMAGLAVPAGFLAGWAWAYGMTIHPAGLSDVVSHIVVGGMFLGLILDGTGAGRWWRGIAGFVFVGGCVWAAVGMPTDLPSGSAAMAAFLVTVGALAGGWVLVLMRLEEHSSGTRAAEGILVLVAVAVGMTLVAAAAGAGQVLVSALILAASAAGFAVVCWVFKLPIGAAALFGGGGALVGMAQALALGWPGTLLPLLILALGLFTGATAGRIPGPAVLKPVWAALLALVPAVLAGVTALAA